VSKFYFSIGIYLATIATEVFYLYANDKPSLVLGILATSLIYLFLLFAMSMSIRQNFYLKAINHNKMPEVVLTFDDGPHPEYTLQILNILDAYKVKAVFFMIGKNVEAYPTIAREVADRGHQIGIHSHHHALSFGFLRANNLRKELEECADVIENITGIRSYLFRPPFGVTNPLVARAAKWQNLATIGWNVRSFDTATENPDKIITRVMKKVDFGSIILLHDRLSQTCEALPQIITKIKGTGFAIGQLSIDRSKHE
jgi:peptidoglycan/xylan/chitin deacetylase (PgdA/CDA1 family)